MTTSDTLIGQALVGVGPGGIGEGCGPSPEPERPAVGSAATASEPRPPPQQRQPPRAARPSHNNLDFRLPAAVSDPRGRARACASGGGGEEEARPRPPARMRPPPPEAETWLDGDCWRRECLVGAERSGLFFFFFFFCVRPLASCVLPTLRQGSPGLFDFLGLGPQGLNFMQVRRWDD